jgi:hypothetical protein
MNHALPETAKMGGLRPQSETLISFLLFFAKESIYENYNRCKKRG